MASCAPPGQTGPSGNITKGDLVQTGRRTALGLGLYVVVTFVLGVYFAFASIQGDFGLLRRIDIDAERAAIEVTLSELQDEVALYRNKTHRLSDAYLDLDLLDEQVRDVLGLVQSDEIVFN